MPTLHEELLRAAYDGDLSKCRTLIHQGADANLSEEAMHVGDTPLCAASRNGKTQACRLLVEHGADINKVGSFGDTPLLSAVSKGQHETARFLIEKGANIHDTAGWRFDPLGRAISSDDLDMCRILLDAGADLLHADQNGRVALSNAASYGHLEICRLLVRRGACPSFVPEHASAEYLTPFQIAVTHMRYDVVEYFIRECGADPDQTTVSGATLYSLAEKMPNMIALLRSAKTMSVIEAAVDVDDGACAHRAGPHNSRGMLPL